MAEEPLDHDSEQPQKKFGHHQRLEFILSKDKRLEPSNAKERDLVDTWIDQRSRLVRELMLVGVFHGGVSGHEVTNAKPNDHQELIQALHDLVARNRFQPTHDMEIHNDHRAIERGSGIKMGHLYWSMREPFIEYWQGRYRTDIARRSVLFYVLEEEKKKKSDWPLDERAWQWIERYFEGCCPQEIEIPDRQDPSAVLEILKHDFELVRTLRLRTNDRKVVFRHLYLDFLGGKYPIVVGRTDPHSEEAMLRVLEEVAQAPRAQSDHMDDRAIKMAIVLQRYRNCVAQELDFDEEEARRREEAQTQARMRSMDFERRKKDYYIEAAFLESLGLSAQETNEWPHLLLRTAERPFFNVNPAYREHVHTHMRWFIERMPWENETAGENPWIPLECMLNDYWIGQYYPDQLRWNVLQEECSKLPPGISRFSNGGLASTYFLHTKYMKGCGQERSKINATQDPELLQIAYDNDMQFIRSLGLSEQVLRRTEGAYNEWLLDGNLPLTADREMPDDRDALLRKLNEHVSGMVGTEWEADPTTILQIFCDHWHPISRRTPPRRE